MLFEGARVWIYSVVVWTVILALWFALPLSRNLTDRSSGRG